jgi:N-acetylglucosaminyldiphosphoundecaprenol N-acetyl-beta-D-mannosaminyltransferase
MLKSELDPIPLVLFGVPFHNVTFDEAVEWVVRRVRSGKPCNIATANLDFVMQAWEDPELQRVLVDADLVIADGFPIVKLAARFGPALKERVTGSDLTPMLMERAAKEGFRVYGLGGGEGVAERALHLFRERFPDLKIAGAYSPPFAPLLEMDHGSIVARLEEAKPDLLFVAFGAPKQDKFISMHVKSWQVPVAMGVGGTLDFIAGAQRRAPKWMQRLHLEWLGRLLADPKRLYKRYLGNVRFLVAAMHQMRALKLIPDHQVAYQLLDEGAIAELAALEAVVESFEPIVTEEAARAFVDRLGVIAGKKSVVLDLHEAAWLDSLELGALLEINKRCRANDRRLILYAVRPKVRQLLETCGLLDYFFTASNLDIVVATVRSLDHAAGGTLYKEGLLMLELPMELTAATVPAFEKQSEYIRQELSNQNILQTIRVDASQLDFIDSSGLGFLIALKKHAMDSQVKMEIVNLDDKPRRVFEIARVDGVLLGC